MSRDELALPFGRFLGHDCRRLCHQHGAYAGWLVEQRWFRSRFPDHHRAVLAGLADLILTGNATEISRAKRGSRRRRRTPGEARIEPGRRKANA